MELQQKLELLADAAKYDASCASSGAVKRDSSDGRGIGSTGRAGICHAYAPDGRCISLLKILLTNFCIYDCAYCVNRNSSNVRRAHFSRDEVVRLTLDFYKRNYIEGLFLSSGIVKSPDHTMEQLVEVAQKLRKEHDFRGYIHLKTIPDADPRLIEEAGRFADRLSVNIELPQEWSLARLAPQKSLASIRETTIPDASRILPPAPPPMLREQRLYQADWLLRFYGFEVGEILAGGKTGMLDLEVDPKLAWALRHRERFPLDLNRAPRQGALPRSRPAARAAEPRSTLRRRARPSAGQAR
jgi:predicted DNA-binding helix-hairpin-helix protein